MITDIVRPKTVAEAVEAKSAPGAAWLGGGTWLNSGNAGHVTTLVSLENLGLDSIHAGSGRCVIGATVTFQELVDNLHVPQALRDAARLTASRTLRNMVTVGGELGLNPADSAVIPVLLALGADVDLAGKKSMPLRNYVDEGSGGLVLGVSVPVGLFGAVRAVSRTSHSPRSLVAAVSAHAVAPVLKRTVIVVSDCRGTLLRLAEAEKGLEGAALPGRERIEQLAREGFSPWPDLHADVEYKRYMAGVLVADLLGSLSALAGEEAHEDHLHAQPCREIDLRGTRRKLAGAPPEDRGPLGSPRR
jgi:putative selenate reductase FAD-binding subunit